MVTAMAVELLHTQQESPTATDPHRVPMASVMLTLMPSDWVQVDSSVSPAQVSLSLASIIMVLVHLLTPSASVMLTLMPMVTAMAVELPVIGEAESPTATGPHKVPMASVMLALMPWDWVQVDSSVRPAPVSPSFVSIIMVLVHSLIPLASVMLTLMPMVMAMAAALPVTGEAESPTATGLLRVPTALALEDSFVSPAPTPPLASTTTAMVPSLTQSESVLLMPLDTVVASLAIGEVAFLTATGPPRVLVPTGVRIFYKTSLYYT